MTEKPEKGKRTYQCIVCQKYYSTGIKRFPTDPDLAQEWLKALHRTSFKPADHVCYDHFDAEKDFHTGPNYKKLKPKAVPFVPQPEVSYALYNETNYYFLFRNLNQLKFE